MTGAPPEPQTVEEVMAELRQLGAVDPEAQDRLTADLLRSDRSLWPLLLTQFRAAAAYRQQAQQREASGNPNGTASPGEAQRLAYPSYPAAPAVALSRPAAPTPTAEASPAPRPIVGARASADPQPVQQPSASVPQQVKAEPALADKLTAATKKSDSPRPVKDAEILPASHDQPAATDLHAHLAAAIRDLESQSKTPPKTEAEIAQQARLRMLYLLDGRREEALRPIPSVPSATQEFWSQQLFALGTWLDTERTPDGPRRAAETKRILNDAMVRLAEAAPLVIRNLTFCSAVQSYGSLTPFPKCEFAPDQELLLYAEVDNFSSEPTPKGFHTSLRSSYQILDSRGQRVDEHEFTTIEETCQSPRRDFFIGYHLRLPKRIYPGKHKLQLTIEDLKSHKSGQSTVEFLVKS
jgi:hypothetical protein